MAAEGWFDRLSARRTRREALKVAAGGLAGAAVASLPLVGGVPKAQAENPNECRKGCIWSVNQGYGSATSNCRWSYGSESALSSIFHFFYVSPLLVPISNMVYAGRTRRCIDRAYKEWKPSFERCLQPFCPGFNPYDPEIGPCATCTAGYYCNPCEAIDSGYICCIYKQGDCHGDCCTVGTGCP